MPFRDSRPYSSPQRFHLVRGYFVLLEIKINLKSYIWFPIASNWVQPLENEQSKHRNDTFYSLFKIFCSND